MHKTRIPFKDRPGRVVWPNNRRVSVRIGVWLEWYDVVEDPRGHAVEDMAGASEFDEYTWEVGVWRVLDLLRRHSVHATFGISAKGAELYPAVVKEIVSDGHEIAGHGYVQSVSAATQGARAERDDIIRCHEILSSISGHSVRGWLHPGAICTKATIDQLLELDYLWHGDLRDDDLPYLIESGNKRLVEIPHRTTSTNDFAMFSIKGIHNPLKGLRSSLAASQYFEDVYNDYAATAMRESPLALEMGIHPFHSCLPDRVQTLDRILEFVAAQGNAWISTYAELAEYWRTSIQLPGDSTVSAVAALEVR